MSKIAVIGGGVSGLTAARLLKDRHEVTVFEKESTPGGLIRCRRVDGCLFHTCGGHVFNSKRQDVLDWFWKLFDRESEFAKTDRNSVVFLDRGNDPQPIPYPIENHVYMMEVGLQRGFIDDMLDLVRKPRMEADNFEDFLRNRFGETLYQLYFRPYNEKVWRRSLKHVPLTWLEGKLPMPTVQEMIFNNMNHVEEKQFVHSTFWYEKNGGSQFIADRLSEGLNIQYNSDIKSIEYIQEEGLWKLDGQEFDKVVFCGNIRQLPAMLDGLDISGFAPALDALEYHGTTSVFCEIDKNPYSWIYLPSDKYKSHRIICTGNFSPSNNAEGKMTGTIEFTDHVPIDEIKENLGRMPLHPRFIDSQYNECTYPIQNESTRSMIKSLKARLAESSFYFTGRFADWEYYNMDAAIGAAINICEKI